MTAPEETARIALDQTRRCAALWQQPVLSDRDAASALNLPYSTWAAIKREPGTPKGFTLGRRLYYQTAALRSWLDARAAS